MPIASPEIGGHEWLARVLVGFARAEQALGKLCIATGFSVEKGSLSNLEALRSRLLSVECKRCKALENRIARWVSCRGQRHLLAHATLARFFDEQGREVIVTRHLPRDKDDLTHDRIWTTAERQELLRVATNDGRSIADQVKNILADKAIMARLSAS
ncbi:MAG: hypothetical protein ACK4ZA_01270 [Tsuneonella troitsensis]